MILDTIDNADKYVGLNPQIDLALRKMKSITADAYPIERIELDGDKLFLLPNVYITHTTADAEFEAHRKYADIMYMVDGEEAIYVKPTSSLKKVFMPYAEDCDALFAEFDSESSVICLKEGSFVVLFPEDAHAPACCIDTPKEVKKVIGKVLL